MGNHRDLNNSNEEFLKGLCSESFPDDPLICDDFEYIETFLPRNY